MTLSERGDARSTQDSDLGASAANRLELNAATLNASTAGSAGNDIFIEDTAGESDWALVLSSSREKKGWTLGMALIFDDQHYRLDEILPPVSNEGWMYHFAFWPGNDIFRRVVDYAAECLDEKKQQEGLLSTKLKRFFKGS